MSAVCHRASDLAKPAILLVLTEMGRKLRRFDGNFGSLETAVALKLGLAPESPATLLRGLLGQAGGGTK